MDVKQTKVSAFFIDNSSLTETLTYIEKNAPLLKSYLLVFSHEVDEKLQQRCQSWNLCYVHNEGQLKNKTSKDQGLDKMTESENKKEESTQTKFPEKKRDI